MNEIKLNKILNLRAAFWLHLKQNAFLSKKDTLSILGKKRSSDTLIDFFLFLNFVNIFKNYEVASRNQY